MTYLVYIVAAVFEIAGCYAFWAWWRLGKDPLWLVPGLLSLIIFAWLLTQANATLAGRAYAAYGGIYIVSSLVWMAVVEKSLPLASDYVGVTLCLAGVAIILHGPTEHLL